MPSSNQHFHGIVMPQELSAEEPTAQCGGSVTAASPGVQHKQEKGQNNKQKSFWPLLWAEPWISKTSQRFLYSSPGTSAHFKSVVHIIPHACVVRGAFSCLTHSCFDTSTSGLQPPFGSRITHRLPNRNNMGIMAPPRPSKAQITLIWPCCFLRSGSSSQEEWEKGTHRE